MNELTLTQNALEAANKIIESLPDSYDFQRFPHRKALSALASFKASQGEQVATVTVSRELLDCLAYCQNQNETLKESYRLNSVMQEQLKFALSL